MRPRLPLRGPERRPYLGRVESVWWTLIILLMLLGLAGSVFPVLPDSLLILCGAFLNHFTISAPHAVGWWALGALTLLSILAHVVDFTAGAVGAKKFGASKWGALGGFLGAIGGLFFLPVGIFLGPVIGVLCAEVLLARRALGPAVKSSWGTLLGTTAGLIGKVVIDVSMVALFLAAVFIR